MTPGVEYRPHASMASFHRAESSGSDSTEVPLVRKSPLGLGSGKSSNPCWRMHKANCRRVASRARARWVTITALAVVLVGAYACAVAQAVYIGHLLAQPVSWPGGLAVSFSAAFGTPVLLVAAAAMGDAVRRRRAHLRAVQAHAADLQREQGQREALASAAERARITREIHDVVAHGLSVMIMQAQAGVVTLDRHPGQTGESLRHIITTGRTALADMRSLLQLSRAQPDLTPPPGVATLPRATLPLMPAEGDPP